MSSNMKNNSQNISNTLISLGVVVVLLGGVIGIKSLRRFYREPPVATRQTNITTIRSWMTLRYISRTYGVPEKEIEAVLMLEPGKYRQSSIVQISKSLGKDPQKVITDIGEVIVNFQTQHPAPPVF